MALAPVYQFQELPEGLELVAPFGRFRVHSGIAVGRCCEVYEGEDCLQGECVAVKVFRRHQQYQGALQRELFFLKSLAATGAPLVRHIGELQWRGRDILVQELLGPTLRDVLLSYDHQPCSPWLVTTLTTHLLRGLQHLHDKGVVHGDLKPPNILWDADLATFKLIDFGVSFTTSEELTHAVQSKGYQAPECVVWSKAVAEDNLESAEKPGTAADVWSAGCIVAECMINRQLFPAGSQCEDVPGDLHSAITSVKTNFPPKYLEECYKFLLRCIQLCPEDRKGVRQLLEDPWLQRCPRPSFHDLLHLPTCVVRFMALTDPHPYPPLAYEMENMVVSLCGRQGAVQGHHLEPSLGHLYVCFHSARKAEAALDQLSGVPFMGHTLVATFYPPEYWMRREFF
ncbi:serine/threonine-protein kinase Kist-like [Scylla paramamosain]|uniref:serine/threonine-protein kinase Kist-like n=1 Tax=Scylla paramamosain TaxID=85552 RepID=UPI0030831688